MVSLDSLSSIVQELKESTALQVEDKLSGYYVTRYALISNYKQFNTFCNGLGVVKWLLPMYL